MKSNIPWSIHSNIKTVVLVAAAALLAGSLAVLYLAGCTDTLKGDEFANQPPKVYFINIPPEGQQFSRNPVVFWYGTDPDGLIDFYRYMLVRVNAMGGMTPEEYLLTVDDSDWTYIYVDPTGPDPQTENMLPLEADSANPVNTFVPQWVFLQAFDMEGLGSEVVYRLFSRNDHPPDTRISDFSAHLPFVDGEPGGIVSGVKMNWSGSDRIDWPADPPPFEFNWRLYGPYEDSTYDSILTHYVKPIFVTEDAHLFALGDTIIRCDTTGDSVSCDTFEVSIAELGSVIWGNFDTVLLVDEPGFQNDSLYNAVADSSFDGEDEWVFNTADTMYRVFLHDPNPPGLDTTLEKNFIFWVRSRDDARVADLTPAFASFSVISPRFERAVGVVDYSLTIGINATLPRGSIKRYWNDYIRAWAATRPELDPDTIFDTIFTDISTLGRLAPDYMDAVQVPDFLAGGFPLAFLLKHKVIVLYDDNPLGSVFLEDADRVYKAIDAGVNVLAMWRAPIKSGPNERPDFAVEAPADFERYFGVEQMVYSSWFCHAFPMGSVLDSVFFDSTTAGWPDIVSPDMVQSDCQSFKGRIEDFVGAYAIDPVNWPDLNVDDSLVQARYSWFTGGRPDFVGLMYLNPALPEVNWSIRSPQTNVLYLYKSLYGPDHPFGGSYNMEGNPVAHRLATVLYRTAHFNFTPLAIEDSTMQIVMNKILDWLWPADLAAPVAGIRYPAAGCGLAPSDARREYWRRNERYDEMRKNGFLGGEQTPKSYQNWSPESDF